MEDTPIQATQADNFGQKQRTKRLTWVGIMLLVGFFMPTYWAGNGFSFTNIGAIFNKNSPDLLKFLCLWPLLAGVITIAVVRINRGFSRALILTGMGFIPPIMIISLTNSHSLAFLSQQKLILGAFGMLGIVGLAGGSRTLHYLPESRAARITAGAGGIVILLYMFIPSGENIPFFAMLSDFYSAYILSTFEKANFFFEIFNILTMFCLMGTAVLCIVGFTNRELIRRLGPGTMILLFALASIRHLLLIAMFSLPSKHLWASPAPDFPFLHYLTEGLKTYFWLWGSFLLAPFGLAELIINRHEKKGAREKTAHPAKQEKPEKEKPQPTGYYGRHSY